MADIVLPKARIYLHGVLKRKFSGPYDLGVQTPEEAIRALDRLKPGFRDILREGDWMLIRGPRHGGVNLDLEMIDFKLGDGGMLHIVPAAMGRGRGGGKIVAGVALVALAIVSYGASIGPTLGTIGTAGFAVSASSVGMMGVGLIFSGAASLLSPQPKTARPTEKEAVAENPSFMMDGPGSVMEQGRIVPLVYVRDVRNGGVLISSSYDTIDVNPDGSSKGLPPTDPDADWKADLSTGTLRFYKGGLLA